MARNFGRGSYARVNLDPASKTTPILGEVLLPKRAKSYEGRDGRALQRGHATLAEAWLRDPGALLGAPQDGSWDLWACMTTRTSSILISIDVLTEFPAPPPMGNRIALTIPSCTWLLPARTRPGRGHSDPRYFALELTDIVYTSGSGDP